MATTLETAAELIAQALLPLAGALEAADQDIVSFVCQLGWQLPSVPAAFHDLAAPSKTLVQHLAQLQVARLEVEAGTGTDDDVLQALGLVAVDLAVLVDAITTLPGKLRTQLPQAYLDATGIASDIQQRLLDFILIALLRLSFPTAYEFFFVLGLVEETAEVADSAHFQPPFTLYRVRWDRIPHTFQDPGNLFHDVYGWGTPALDIPRLFEAIRRLSTMLLAPAIVGYPDDALLRVLSPGAAVSPDDGPPPLLLIPLLNLDVLTVSAALIPLPSASPADAQALAVTLVLTGALTDAIPLTDTLTLTGQAEIDLTTGAALVLRPGQPPGFVSGLNSANPVAATGKVGLRVTRAGAEGQRVGILSAADGVVVDATQLFLGVGAGGQTAGGVDCFIEAGLIGARLLIETGQVDSFLAAILPANGIEVDFEVSVQWSKTGGVHFQASSGLDTTIGLHLSIGPISLESLHLRLATTSSGLQFDASVTATAQLGPIAGSVTGIGLTTTLQPDAGNLGPVDLVLGFRPPDGLALALDADPVSGVGFLAFDVTNVRYLGALELAVGDVSISAVGVLDTRLPGGAKGYSLIVVASATFPPVQLGLGFSLTGIGGLVGVNRTVDVPSLQALARAGRLDDLMFPADLIHRAPQVAANLAQVFPPAQDHFIVGPAVQIEWGEGGMVDAEIGVFIELSDSGGGINLLRVALLGWLHLSLPDPLTPVADLKLDVLGLLDIPGKTLSLDAGLRDSKIADFPITGQAAVRASWGANASLVIALGGFNPHFAVPAGFPALQRLTLAIGGDNPRLTLSAYLALTSNTLQLGCSADLYASVGTSVGTAAVSASLTFDALMQFKPFGLIVDLTIAATVLLDGNAIMTLNLDLHVTGPNPWTATGSAHFHALFCDVTIPISIPAGPQPPPQQPQTVNLDGNLTAALADLHSWQTGPPAGRGVVTVRGQDAAHPAVHPLGSLTVRQHAVPLGQRIVRYGPDLVDACQYDITGATLGGLDAPTAAVTDSFAPAQFLQMDDAAKLSSPSFEPMTAGVTLGSPLLTLPAAPGSAKGSMTVVDTRSTSDWNMLTLDSPDPSGAPAATAPVPPAMVAAPGTVALPDTLLQSQLPGAAAAVNGPGGHGAARYSGAGGSGIALKEPSYAVVGMNLAGIGADPGRRMLIPTTAAAPSRAPAGVSGMDWQVVYTSEMAGPGGTG